MNLSNITVYPEQWSNVNGLVYSLGVISVCWTIAANITILICFVRNKRRPWTSFTRQTCSMTVSDLLVGLTAIPILILELNNGIMNGICCWVNFYLFFAIQCVSLYHVLGICLLRNIRMKTLSQQQNGDISDSTYTKRSIASAWTFSFVVILCPFVLWSEPQNQNILCSTDGIFKTNLKLSNLYLGVTFFISQCFTNLIYIITCFRFWRIIRKTAPFQNGVQRHPVPSVSLNTTSTTGSRQESSQTKQVTLISIGNGGGGETSWQTVNQSQDFLSVIKTQKRVIGTIGILLLLFNVFTLPLTMVLFSEQTQSPNRNVRFVICSLFLINSGVNPIVYATRVAALREAVKCLFNDIFCFCS